MAALCEVAREPWLSRPSAPSSWNGQTHARSRTPADGGFLPQVVVFAVANVRWGIFKCVRVRTCRLSAGTDKVATPAGFPALTALAIRATDMDDCNANVACWIARYLTSFHWSAAIECTSIVGIRTVVVHENQHNCTCHGRWQCVFLIVEKWTKEERISLALLS